MKKAFFNKYTFYLSFDFGKSIKENYRAVVNGTGMFIAQASMGTPGEVLIFMQFAKEATTLFNELHLDIKFDGEKWLKSHGYEVDKEPV